MFNSSYLHNYLHETVNVRPQALFLPMRYPTESRALNPSLGNFVSVSANSLDFVA